MRSAITVLLASKSYGGMILAKQVAEAVVAPVLTGGLVDRLVLAEHHPPRERCFRRRKARRDGILSAAAHAIQDAGEPAAPPPGRPRPLEQQLTRDAAPAEQLREARLLRAAGAVGGGAVRAPAACGGARQRPDVAIHRQLRADLDAFRQARPAGDAKEEPGSLHAAARDAHLGGCAEWVRTRW